MYKLITLIRAFFFGDAKLAKEIPFFSFLIFTPASLISGILLIPFTLICLPTLLFSKKFQNTFLKTMLYIQHSISLGGLYSIQEYFFDSFELKDLIIATLISFITFYKSIGVLVNETLENV